MHMTDIELIEFLIQTGQAYEVDGYIVFDSTHHDCPPLCPPPIQYPILVTTNKVRRSTDYPLWSPVPKATFIPAQDSPWGTGLVTANLYYLKANGCFKTHQIPS
jgi:hypothetical protein